MNHLSINNHPLRNLSTGLGPAESLFWQGPLSAVSFDEAGSYSQLLQLNQPCFVVRYQDRIGFTNQGTVSSIPEEGTDEVALLFRLPPVRIENLGDPSFLEDYGLRFPYMTGAMANGISSVELVIALGKAGMLGSFGAAGLSPNVVEAAITRLQEALPYGPYAFNVIHSPNEPELEHRIVELYLKHRVEVVEASAFLGLTANIVHYRVAGLALDPSGEIQIRNKIIAKLSRREVAAKFMEPAPTRLLEQLLAENRITPHQASLAEKVPMADDITVEADSGGHTDNRPLVNLLPSMIALRDEIQNKYGYKKLIRVGAAGGISTPSSALAALMMGAAYITTGSINQACEEAGTCSHTRKLLSQAAMTDVIMAPSADMFEMGVRVQVLKAGTMFAMRAMKLFELYNRYNSVDEIPKEEREKIEKQIFRRDLESVWQDTVKFFLERDPEQIDKANANPKRKMALIFRWYLGLSSRWSNAGESGREIDYQIWCGPAMGAFNDWVRGSYLEDPNQRRVVDLALQILTGSAYQFRIQMLRAQGFQVPPQISQYRPAPLEQ